MAAIVFTLMGEERDGNIYLSSPDLPTFTAVVNEEYPIGGILPVLAKFASYHYGLDIVDLRYHEEINFEGLEYTVTGKILGKRIP